MKKIVIHFADNGGFLVEDVISSANTPDFYSVFTDKPSLMSSLDSVISDYQVKMPPMAANAPLSPVPGGNLEPETPNYDTDKAATDDGNAAQQINAASIPSAVGVGEQAAPAQV